MAEALRRQSTTVLPHACTQEPPRGDLHPDSSLGTGSVNSRLTCRRPSLMSACFEAASLRRLSLHDMELDSVDEGVVADRSRVGRPLPKGLKIDLA